MQRHRGDDDHVSPLVERLRGEVAEAVDLLVGAGVLLDVGVAPRDVRFRLVVVVVGHEVLDRVMREELPKLPAELGGQGLVVRDHQRRLVMVRWSGQGHRLAGAGRAEQDLVRRPFRRGRRQPLDRRRAGRPSARTGRRSGSRASFRSVPVHDRTEQVFWATRPKWTPAS